VILPHTERGKTGHKAPLTVRRTRRNEDGPLTTTVENLYGLIAVQRAKDFSHPAPKIKNGSFHGYLPTAHIVCA
jgi:hypothetical protein